MGHSNLDGIYETLKDWRARFPNIDCISVSLSSNEMRIRVDWLDESHYTYHMTHEYLDSSYNLDVVGYLILEEIERKYRIHTVGEE